MYIAIDRETGEEVSPAMEMWEQVEHVMEMLGIPRSHYYILEMYIE